MSELLPWAMRLRQQLQDIEKRMMNLLDVSTTHSRSDPASSIIVIGPPYGWDKANARQEQLQFEIKESYLTWFEQFSLLFRNAPKVVQKRIEETNKFVVQWIEREINWDIKPTIEENKQKFREKVQVFYQRIPDVPDNCEVILVLDTNALIVSPEPSSYSQVAGKDKYQFVIVATVLGELENLKVRVHDITFRNKVKSVIKRIKGWRKQGNLLQGVTVNKTVTVKAEAPEPDFKETLHWLDSSNKDDRIIASVLEIQRAQPSAKVVLVTSDINLQNKAEMASLPYSEPPETAKKIGKGEDGASADGRPAAD